MRAEETKGALEESFVNSSVQKIVQSKKCSSVPLPVPTRRKIVLSPLLRWLDLFRRFLLVNQRKRRLVCKSLSNRAAEQKWILFTKIRDLESFGKMLCRGTWYKQIARSVWKNPILKCYYDEILMSCLSQRITYTSSLRKTKLIFDWKEDFHPTNWKFVFSHLRSKWACGIELRLCAFGLLSFCRDVIFLTRSGVFSCSIEIRCCPSPS